MWSHADGGPVTDSHGRAESSGRLFAGLMQSNYYTNEYTKE